MNTFFIKVALRGVSPMIWRRLRVSGNTSLANLHCIIQEDGARYYKIDEHFALLDIFAKVITANKRSKDEILRSLIEHYEDARFTRVLINKQLVEAFHN